MVASMVSEYDRRQLALILEMIDLFEKGALSLSEIVNNLSALVDVLESIDEIWKDEYRQWWWDLEEVYSVALDRKISLDKEDELIITKALNQIKSLIKERLQLFSK